MDKHWWELYYALPEHTQYDIDMDLWAEFGDGVDETEEDRKATLKEMNKRRKQLTKRAVLYILEQYDRKWAIDKIIDEEMEKRK